MIVHIGGHGGLSISARNGDNPGADLDTIMTIV